MGVSLSILMWKKVNDFYIWVTKELKVMDFIVNDFDHRRNSLQKKEIGGSGGTSVMDFEKVMVKVRTFFHGQN